MTIVRDVVITVVDQKEASVSVVAPPNAETITPDAEEVAAQSITQEHTNAELPPPKERQGLGARARRLAGGLVGVVLGGLGKGKE